MWSLSYISYSYINSIFYIIAQRNNYISIGNNYNINYTKLNIKIIKYKKIDMKEYKSSYKLYILFLFLMLSDFTIQKNTSGVYKQTKNLPLLRIHK
jgi:hypothetical protein